MVFCYYCNRKIANKESSYKLTLYKETSRYKILNKTKVEFKQTEILIPRCNKCKKIHSKKISIVLFVCIFAQIGLILGLTVLKSWILLMLGGGYFGFLFSLLFLNPIYKKNNAKKNNIKTEDDINNYEPVACLLNEKWSFFKPEA